MSQPAFVDFSRYYLAYEYPTKIRLAVEVLADDAVWHRFDEQSNSIGNLLLHLSGNVRQWIVSGIGGDAADRDRAGEFNARNGPARDELLSLLDRAVRDADAVLATIDQERLADEVTIQGRSTTVLAAIYHVVEHFSMHTGQIIMLAKIHSPGKVAFYEDADGLAIPRWGGSERMPGV